MVRAQGVLLAALLLMLSPVGDAQQQPTAQTQPPQPASDPQQPGQNPAGAARAAGVPYRGQLRSG